MPGPVVVTLHVGRRGRGALRRYLVPPEVKFALLRSSRPIPETSRCQRSTAAAAHNYSFVSPLPFLSAAARRLLGPLLERQAPLIASHCDPKTPTQRGPVASISRLTPISTGSCSTTRRAARSTCRPRSILDRKATGLFAKTLGLPTHE
jgi:hypothetical protein